MLPTTLSDKTGDSFYVVIRYKNNFGQASEICVNMFYAYLCDTTV